MCLGAQAKMSHEMRWWKSEDLQHFPWCWVCVLASLHLQHAKAGAFKTEHSKMVTVSLLWGTAAGFHQAVPRSPRFPLCFMETILEKYLAANLALLTLLTLALLTLEGDLPPAAAGGWDFCLCWGSMGNKQFWFSLSSLHFLPEEKQLVNLYSVGCEMR